MTRSEAQGKEQTSRICLGPAFRQIRLKIGLERILGLGTAERIQNVAGWGSGSYSGSDSPTDRSSTHIQSPRNDLILIGLQIQSPRTVQVRAAMVG